MRMADSLRNRWSRLGLQARLNLQLASLTCILFAVLLPLVLVIQQSTLRQAAQAKGYGLVRVFAFSSVQGVIAEDFLSLRELARSLARQPEVRYAMVLDLNGRAIMHSRVQYTDTILHDPLTVNALRATEPLLQETLSDKGEHLYDFTAPVYVLNERRAVARIGISVEEELRLLRYTRGTILALGGLTLIGALLWVQHHVRRLARPIQALARGAEAVAHGDLDRRVETDRQDELGSLAQAFNRMAESLRVRFEVDRELSSTLDLDAVLTTLVRHAGRLAGADLAFLASRVPQESEAAVVACTGARGEAIRGWRIRPGRGAAGAALAAGHATSRLETDAIDPAESLVLAEEAVHSWILVPIRIRESCVGLLGAAYRQDGDRIAGKQEVLRQLADQAAVAVANALAYREIEELSRTLELKVAARTQELSEANKALEASHEKLRELDRLKSDFVSNVSHELRTPLATIRVSVENLLDGIAGEVNPTLRRSLARVKDNTDRLTRLITDLLDLSRIEAGRVEVRLAPVALSPAIQEVLEGFRAVAARKGLTIAAADDGERLLAHADRDKLHQILVNLVGNAVKFTPAGGSVTVETRRCPEGGGWGVGGKVEGSGPHSAFCIPPSAVEISVTDTGEGIPPEELHAIFDKFHQVRRDGQSKTAGTGLGLAIAKSLVELQGGRIWAESQLGHGSRVVFTLLAAERAPAAPPSPEPGARP